MKIENSYQFTNLIQNLGRENIAKLLIASGADVHAKDPDTPLHWCANSDHYPFNPNVAKLLIVAGGADVQCDDEQGKLPIDLAESAGILFCI